MKIVPMTAERFTPLQAALMLALVWWFVHTSASNAVTVSTEVNVETISVPEDEFSQSSSVSIDDQAKIFSKDALQRLLQTITTCQQQAGVQIHLVTHAEIQDNLEAKLQQELQNRVKDQPGLVVLYGWGMDRPHIKPSVSLGQWFSLLDQDSILREANEAFVSNTNLVLSQRLTLVIQTLSKRYIEIQQQRRAHELNQNTKELYLSLATVVMGAALLMWVALRWLQQSSARPLEHYFPQVEVGMRLGASYGGGYYVETPGTSRKVVITEQPTRKSK